MYISLSSATVGLCLPKQMFSRSIGLRGPARALLKLSGEVAGVGAALGETPVEGELPARSKIGCVESSERTIAGTVILLPVRSEDSTHPTTKPLSKVEIAQPLKEGRGQAPH